MSVHIRRLRLWFAILSVVAIVCLASCSRSDSAKTMASTPHMMGNPVAVGPLTYTVIHAEWKDSLEGPMGSRSPKDRFLILDLSVSNTGTDERGIPMMTLIGKADASYPEEEKGEGIPHWLGFLRTAKPGGVEHGQVLFDVPVGAYKLRVASGGEPESEETALIDIPLQIEAPTENSPDVLPGAAK
jgi:hypothetical protein